MQCRITKQHTMTQEERVAAEASQHECVAPEKTTRNPTVDLEALT